MQNVPLVWKFCEFAVKFMCTIHVQALLVIPILWSLFPVRSTWNDSPISFQSFPSWWLIPSWRSFRSILSYCRWSDLWYLHDYTVFVSIIPGIKSKWLNCHKNIMSVTAHCLKRNVKNLFSNCTKLICPFQYLEVGS